jgi:coenzyme Q-binding protein COQ10
MEMLADLAIGYKMLRETYSSRIEMGASPLSVTVHQAKGPFRHLFNQWVFEDTETGSEVHFELQFEFAVPLLRRIIQPMMNRVVERFIAAFETRALDIYGS